MHILFDLDGTICNTEEGIVNCALFALSAGNHPAPSPEKLRGFIGPPLLNSFTDICGLTETQGMAAIQKFRERYREKGMYEQRLYPGIRELFEELTQRGHRLYVATSKVEHFALQILEGHGVDRFFEVIRGSTPDGSLSEKADIIADILKDIPAGEKALMVGDTRFDILGAKENGIESVAVGYGFAAPGELSEAEYYCETVEDLRRFFCEEATL